MIWVFLYFAVGMGVSGWTYFVEYPHAESRASYVAAVFLWPVLLVIGFVCALFAVYQVALDR